MGLLSNLIDPESLANMIPPDFKEYLKNMGDMTICHYNEAKEINEKLDKIILLLEDLKNGK